MSWKGRLTQIFLPFFIRLAFALKLRKPWSLFVRRLQGETARHPVRVYDAPGELERAMKEFQYRKDPWEGSLDYVSHPEYVEAVLRDPKVRDGDCDDGHWYVANALKKISGVEKVFFLSSGFSSPTRTSAHATAVYKYGGKWYHYDWGIHEIGSPNDAPLAVAKRYAGDDAEVTFWVWESVGEEGNDRSGWQPVAIYPEELNHG